VALLRKMSSFAALIVQIICTTAHITGWRRPFGCLIIIHHVLQNTPIISDSFAKNDLRLKISNGSSPPCIIDIMFIYSLFFKLSSVVICFSMNSVVMWFWGILLFFAHTATFLDQFFFIAPLTTFSKIHLFPT